MSGQGGANEIPVPADLRLLLEGTGLTLIQMEIEGVAVEEQAASSGLEGPLRTAWSYLVKLARETGG
jgi:hypothetical protein